MSLRRSLYVSTDPLMILPRCGRHSVIKYKNDGKAAVVSLRFLYLDSRRATSVHCRFHRRDATECTAPREARKCSAQVQRGKEHKRAALVFCVFRSWYVDTLLRPVRIHLHLFDCQKKRGITGGKLRLFPANYRDREKTVSDCPTRKKDR